MKAIGKDLLFISRINRDGSGTEIINGTPIHLQGDVFKLLCLSLTEKTYIAHGFNSYVVRFKKINSR